MGDWRDIGVGDGADVGMIDGAAGVHVIIVDRTDVRRASVIVVEDFD